MLAIIFSVAPMSHGIKNLFVGNKARTTDPKWLKDIPYHVASLP